MIISHRHKFIFIKTRKTAGTSIEAALASICGPDDIMTPPDPDKHKETGLKSHSGMADLCRIFQPGDAPLNYFTFCFERNPWDKTVSWFHYLKVRHNLTWEKFIDGELLPQCRAWKQYTAKNAVIVDKVYKYENLENDWFEIGQRLEVDLPELPQLNSEYRPSHIYDYKHYYTPSQMDKVAELYKPEIWGLNYEF